MECNICCQEINKTKRVLIECCLCKERVCRECIQTFLLNSSKLEPGCMCCNETWSYEFFVEKMTKVFVNKQWKDHRQNVLLELEKIRLPETQENLIREKRIKQLEEERRQVVLRINTEIYELNKKPKETNKMFCKKCPQDECQGFLSTKWKCGICETSVCSKCGEIKQDEHLCLEDDIKTMELLKKDTKNCPRCATMIHKIDGCNQMWCIQCHVAFDWRTMKIEDGKIHNPHYYEWMRQNNTVMPRVVGDDPCNREVLFEMSRRFKKLNSIHRFIIDYENIRPKQSSNEDVRKKFLLNEIKEDDLKRIVQRREKEIKKYASLNQVMTMFVDVSKDVFIKLETNQMNENRAKDQLEQLREYTNSCLERVLKQFNSKQTIQICKFWRNMEIKKFRTD